MDVGSMSVREIREEVVREEGKLIDCSTYPNVLAFRSSAEAVSWCREGESNPQGTK
jgi:hypothetical protein